jgi:GTP diphosphokinase / guanosine-3',5'-bis(diphosphate) 3'-diphosphatase
MVQADNDIAKVLAALTFAAERHRDQRRKGANAAPYINHPIEVAEFLARVGGVTNVTTLISAILHDTIEDTNATAEEIKNMFGDQVLSVVLELTDDKSLPKQERKRLQIEYAARLSHEAKNIKLADKISNIREIADSPPEDWSIQRRREYADWAESVVACLRGSNPTLEALFDESLRDIRSRLEDRTITE